jgi:hypothetical protein
VFAYSKVTIKAILSVLISCYSTKEWIEWYKRKQLMQRQLNKLKPRLNLFGANGEFNCSNWRVFKKNYNINSTTMQALLEALGDEFFSGAK